jgi:uncharacterized membrane protein YfhO
MLVVADQYYPGWKATVTSPGREPASEHVARVDYLLRAVRVPAGRCTVTLRYEPTAFRLGLYFGLLGAACAVGLAATRRPPPRR